MMNLTFDAKVRIPFPLPARLDLQSLYLFNLYRSGSSVVEAAAEALSLISKRTLNNVMRRLYDANVELSDTLNYSASITHLAENGAPLLKLCEIGGYLNYGFREVPIGFATKFRHLGASILIVRDPRDIGISHYSAVKKHDVDNIVYGKHVEAARGIAAGHPIHEYILTDEVIGFLNRICQCYAPMIENGVPVVRYEELFVDGRFNVSELCRTIFETFHHFHDEDWSLEEFVTKTKLRISNSKALKGHSTDGAIAMYQSLPESVLTEYNERLKDSIHLLGY